MNVKNCKRCSKMFSVKTSDYLCDACIEQLEEEFRRIKEHLNVNPNDTLQSVSDATGVSKKQLLTWLREGRLEATPGMEQDLSCRVCGNPVVKGHMCKNCAESVGQETEDLYRKDKAEKTPKGGFHSKF